MAEPDTPDMKDKDNYKNISHKTDLTDDDYTFDGEMAKASEIQKTIGVRFTHVRNRLTCEYENKTMSPQECVAWLLSHIDRQAEQLQAHEECQEDVRRLTKELDNILSGEGAAERPMLCDVIKTAWDVMGRLKALEKNPHEECASSAQTIRILQEQVKAKDDVEAHLRKSWHEAEEMLVIVRADCAKYEHLNETVALTCTPPDDCNDPVVLKRYMKACFDAVVEDEDIAK